MTMIYLPEDLEELLERGEDVVRKYVRAQGGFAPFAFARQADGEIVAVLASDEYPTLAAALGDLIGVLMPQARDGRVTASILCSSVPRKWRPTPSSAA